MELAIDGGSTVVARAGHAPVVNGVEEQRMRAGCGSATIGMFAKQWHGHVDEVIVVDDHITGVLTEHQAGVCLGMPPAGIRVQGRKSTPGRYFQVARPGTGWGGTNITEPLSIIRRIDPGVAWPGMRVLLTTTTGEDSLYCLLDENRRTLHPAPIPDPVRRVVERIGENCEPSLCSVLFMAGAGGSLRGPAVTENPVRLTDSIRSAATRVTMGGAPVYVWPGGGITVLVDVTRLPADAFGYVPTPAIVAPIEFTLSLADYEALGGHLAEAIPLSEIPRRSRRRGRRAPLGCGEPLAVEAGRTALSPRAAALPLRGPTVSFARAPIGLRSVTASPSNRASHREKRGHLDRIADSPIPCAAWTPTVGFSLAYRGRSRTIRSDGAVSGPSSISSGESKALMRFGAHSMDLQPLPTSSPTGSFRKSRLYSKRIMRGFLKLDHLSDFPGSPQILRRELPSQHRPPDHPGLDIGVHQLPQRILAGIFVRGRCDSEPGSHLGVPRSNPEDVAARSTSRRTAWFWSALHQKVFPVPAHPDNERSVRIHRLEMRPREVHIFRERILAVAGALRQIGQRVARRSNVKSNHADPPPSSASRS